MKNSVRYIFTLVVLLATYIAALAQDANSESEQLSNAWFWLLIGSAILIVCAAFFVLMRLLLSMMNRMELQEYQKHGVESIPVSAKKEKASKPLLTRLYKNLFKTVPLEREKDILFDHDYDGIRELDNSLPPWWLYGFYLTIVFGFLYLGYYHVFGIGKSSHEEYTYEMQEAESEIKAYLASMPTQVDETNVTVATDAAALEQGHAIWTGNCAVCHLESGAGLVGPNMTDNYWVHGGDIKSIFKIIKYGVPEKGMISWSTQLRPVEMQNVGSYILTLVGTNPENPKAPQGDLYVPEEEPSSDGEGSESM